MGLDEVDRRVSGKMKKRSLLIASIFSVKLEKMSSERSREEVLEVRERRWCEMVISETEY